MKKFTKILCGVLSVGFLLTGCATVGNIKNSSDELIYNGNSAVVVDDYLYFGNSLAEGYSSWSGDSDYKSGAKLSYLARLNKSVELAATSQDYSPKSVEKVNDEVTSYSNDFMFVLGNYIYFATPNRQKIAADDGTSSYNFSYTTLYRSKLNGDSKEKIYTTNGEVSQIEAVKYGNKYYVVMLAGTDLIKIEIGNKFSVKVISDSATSMAIPQTQDYSTSTLDWDGYIYYTEDKTVGDYSDISGSYVYRVSVAGGDAQKLFWKQGKTVKFVGRVKDVLFYTYNPTNQTEVFVSDMTNTTSASTFENNQTLFLADTSISDISVLSSGVRDTGYLFYNSSSALMFKPTNGSARIVTFSVDGSELSSYNILFVTGRTVYLSTTTGIYKASIADDGSTTCETIVTMTAIYDGTNYAYDGSYIYFYAQLEAIDDDEEDSDTNYYMYRAKIKYLQEDKSQNYELLSYTQLSSRHTQGK